MRGPIRPSLDPLEGRRLRSASAVADGPAHMPAALAGPPADRPGPLPGAATTDGTERRTAGSEAGPAVSAVDGGVMSAAHDDVTHTLAAMPAPGAVTAAAGSHGPDHGAAPG